MICEALCALSAVLALVAFFKREKIEFEVVERELAKKREKVRKRYVLAICLSEEPDKLNAECLDEAIKDAVRRAYGAVGLALARPKVVYFDLQTKGVIIRTTLDGVKLISSALLWLGEACGTKVNVVPLRAFGTLASARKKLPKLNYYVKQVE